MAATVLTVGWHRDIAMCCDLSPFKSRDFRFPALFDLRVKFSFPHYPPSWGNDVLLQFGVTAQTLLLWLLFQSAQGHERAQVWFFSLYSGLPWTHFWMEIWRCQHSRKGSFTAVGSQQSRPDRNWQLWLLLFKLLNTHKVQEDSSKFCIRLQLTTNQAHSKSAIFLFTPFVTKKGTKSRPAAGVIVTSTDLRKNQ